MNRSVKAWLHFLPGGGSICDREYVILFTMEKFPGMEKSTRTAASRSCGYDAENRLVLVSGGASASFIYDGGECCAIAQATASRARQAG